MSNPDRFWFLFSAYAAIWTLLAVFLIRLGRKHRATTRELEALRARLGNGVPGGPPGAASRE
jgi:CcmD family protein